MRVLIGLLLALTACFPVAAQDFSHPELGGAIWEGVATDDDIWLLGATKKVVKFDRSTGASEVVIERARDLLRDGDRLWILSQDEPGYSTYLRDVWDPQDDPVRLGVQGDLIGLFPVAGADRPGILSTEMVVLPNGDEWDRRQLAAKVEQGKVTADDQGRIYLGYNRGEWGGGLRLLSSDGSVSFVTQQGDDICDGELNPACDPVVGLLPDENAPGCILAGIGLAHLGLSKGKLYRVCDTEITPVFSAPRPADGRLFPLPDQAYNFTGVEPLADGWIALSGDRYFRWRDGGVSERSLPTFSEWSGLRISAEQDGVIFLVAACCWGSVENPELFRTISIPIFSQPSR